MPPSVKPTPPLVSDCLVVPQGRVTAPPTPPTPLTDQWAKQMWSWASGMIGLVTTEREQWQGERACIRGKVEAGAVR
jgi:hypothetical protein